MPQTAPPALEVTGVSHAFGAVTALDDVSLTVPRGGVTALLGVNGAGKTTLFNLVTRLYANRSGTIRVAGSARQVRQQMGGLTDWHLSQEKIFNLNPPHKALLR